MSTFYSTNAPASSVSIPAVGTNGQPIPLSSIEIGGQNPEGNLTPVAVKDNGSVFTTPDPAGVQHVIVDSSALPAGAATATNQASEITQLTAINANTTGVSTAALQASGNASLTSIASNVATAANQTNGTQVTQITGTVPLPTGAATAALQSSTQGSVAGGASATVSTLTGGQFNTTPPSLTNGQQAALQLNSSGYLEITEPDLIVTGQAAQTATINNILTTTAGTAASPTNGLRTAAVQVTSTGTAGTFIFEGSNDNTNFVAIPVFNQLILTGTPIIAAITASASTIVYLVPLSVAFIRLRIATAITGGSIQAITKYSAEPIPASIIQVAQGTPANLQTTATIASGTVTTVSTVSSVTSSNLGIPSLIADVASAAITTTTTTATITPTFGSSYLVDIPVTAVSGTTPTMSVAVQESPDSGTNWYPVYTFPTITTTGSYTSPVITLTGNRVRYVQTITGTTPSFTRAINRLQSSQGNYSIPSGTVYIDRSGTTSGTPSTSTQLAPFNNQRRYLLIQNLNTTTAIYINFTSAATVGSGSFYIAPLGSYVAEAGTISIEQVNVISTGASVAYSAKEG